MKRKNRRKEKEDYENLKKVLITENRDLNKNEEGTIKHYATPTYFDVLHFVGI